MNEFRCLSVRQPFAELIASGRKTIEVRTKPTRYRGQLIICAAGAWHRWGVELHGKLGVRGVAVCRVELVDCRPLTWTDAPDCCFPFTVDDPAHKLYTPGAHAWGWILRGARRLPPVPVSGALGLFSPDPEVAQLLAVA